MQMGLRALRSTAQGGTRDRVWTGGQQRGLRGAGSFPMVLHGQRVARAPCSGAGDLTPAQALVPLLLPLPGAWPSAAPFGPLHPPWRDVSRARAAPASKGRAAGLNGAALSVAGLSLALPQQCMAQM